MNALTHLPLIIALIGGLVYLLVGPSANPVLVKIAELGRLAFLAGLAAWLFGK